jgi:hypothetical protein
MDFLNLSKCPLLLKMPLYTEVPGSFDSVTNLPLDHGLDLGKKEIEEIESLDLGAAWARRNPAAPVAGSVEKEVGEACELTDGRGPASRTYDSVLWCGARGRAGAREWGATSHSSVALIRFSPV